MPPDNDHAQNVPADNLSHAERLSLLDRGRYLIIGGRIIAHKDALPTDAAVIPPAGEPAAPATPPPAAKPPVVIPNART
jgi:hypothetical protein